MAIPRVFWHFPLIIEQRTPLGKEDYHHLLTVLRLKTGESVLLFDGNSEYLATLFVTGKKSAELFIEKATDNQPESPLILELAVCLYRGKQFDTSIQKAVELGVHAITPLISHKSDIAQNAKAAEKRAQHLKKIIIAACEQSGRIKPPVLNPEMTFNTWLALSKNNLTIACDFSPSTLSWESKPTEQQTVSVLIGPAGGFITEESSALKRAEVPNLNLGPRILRSDTATTVALGLIQSHWGDLG